MFKRLFGRSDDDRPRKIRKAEKKITNMWIQRQDRQYYLDLLRSEGTEVAARALTERFNHTCDNSTVDRDEKELTAHFLVSMGDTAVEPLKDYIRENDRGVNWPFRALKEMLSEEEIIEFLADVLDSIGPDYVREPERKEQLILTAKEYQCERIAKALVPYLDDDNETIRFVAADAVASMGDEFEFVRPPLADRLTAETSNRVVSRVADYFIEHDWDLDLSDTELDLNEFLPDGYQVTSDGKLKST